MSRVTIYTRDADDEEWAWARWLAKQERHSLARVVADALRAYRAVKEAETAKEEVER